MNKDKTLTAEDFLTNLEWCEDNYHGKYYEWIKEDDLHKVMEQYAQTKVLEALESLQSKLLELEEDAKTKSQNSEGYSIQYSLL